MGTTSQEEAVSKRKPKLPVLRWPWCDLCAAHVREVDGARHWCRPEQLWLSRVPSEPVPSLRASGRSVPAQVTPAANVAPGAAGEHVECVP
jgi:hypothetical protein